MVIFYHIASSIKHIFRIKNDIVMFWYPTCMHQPYLGARVWNEPYYKATPPRWGSMRELPGQIIRFRIDCVHICDYLLSAFTLFRF